MTNVLSMTTGQLGHPIAMFVLVISDNPLVHERSSLQRLKRPFRTHIGPEKTPMACGITIERSDEQQT